MTTPLHEAVKGGNLRSVTDLLEQGADANATDATGRTPIWYVFDCVTAGRESIDVGYYLHLALTKRGSNTKDDALREWLSAKIDSLREVDERSRMGIRIQMGLMAPELRGEDERLEEASARGTADDTPVRWCDWALTAEGYRMWVIAHPEIQATDLTLDDALDGLIEATLEKLQDYEPNIHFVRPLPSIAQRE